MVAAVCGGGDGAVWDDCAHVMYRQSKVQHFKTNTTSYFIFSLLFFSFVWEKTFVCLKGAHDVNVDIATYCFIPSFPAHRVTVKYLGETGQAQQGNAVARGGGYAT